MKLATLRNGIIATLGAAAIAITVATPASADSISGWTGPTPAVNGTIFLHNSTITNAPVLRADGAIWTSFGTLVAPNNVGVQPRLFKSGVLCAIGIWTYNPNPAANLSSGVAGDCGTGSYNSHAFVRVRNGTAFNDYVTFPTNPLDWTSPSSARGAAGSDSSEGAAAGVTADGRTFGSGMASESDQIPDLIAAVNGNGEVGYVERTAIESGDATGSVPLYDSNGVNVVGEFAIG